jgi:hypothetical protein
LPRTSGAANQSQMLFEELSDGDVEGVCKLDQSR